MREIDVQSVKALYNELGLQDPDEFFKENVVRDTNNELRRGGKTTYCIVYALHLLRLNNVGTVLFVTINYSMVKVIRYKVEEYAQKLGIATDRLTILPRDAHSQIVGYNPGNSITIYDTY